jgi:tetraprenyl-beta-curcumene synthase
MSDGRAPFADRRLLARAGIALLLANARYWSTVAPLVHAQLSRWERRAEAIPDPQLRTPALDKLRGERFNVQSAATLATLAPRAHRAGATRATVALQVMYDYLDLLTEQPLPDPARGGRRLFTALLDALTLEPETGGGPREPQAGGPELQAGEGPRELQAGGDYYRHHPRAGDGGYLGELVRTVRLELSRLPAAAAVAAVARESAARCAQAQVLGHAAARAGTDELELWARREATDTTLGWPEYLAGAAASVLAVHALIAAAADARTTSADAVEIDAAYLSIGALTMLDSLIDRDADIATGQLGYARFYASPEAMATALVGVARDATRRARLLPRAAHHVMTLVGIVAYYASAPAAKRASAQPVTARLIAELRPLIAPTLALMRSWRLAKRVRHAH